MTFSIDKKVIKLEFDLEEKNPVISSAASKYLCLIWKKVCNWTQTTAGSWLFVLFTKNLRPVITRRWAKYFYTFVYLKLSDLVDEYKRKYLTDEIIFARNRNA